MMSVSLHIKKWKLELELDPRQKYTREMNTNQYNWLECFSEKQVFVGAGQPGQRAN